MFFWNSLAFLMIQQMLAIQSLVLLPFLNRVIPFSRASFQPRDQTQIFRIAGGFFTREALKILMLNQKSQIQKMFIRYDSI